MPQVTRGGRVSKPPQRLIAAHSTVCAYLATFSPAKNDNDHLLQPATAAYTEPHPLSLLANQMFSFVATDPDTMTLKEALAQPDKAYFLKSMKKELNDHITWKHWKVFPAKNVPFS